MPRFRPPKFRERNRARALFGTGLSDVAIARAVGVSPRSIGRWRRAWEDGTDWDPGATSFGAITRELKRRG